MTSTNETAGSANSAQAKIDVESILSSLVMEFSGTPLANGKKMRDLMRMDIEAFRLASVTILRKITDARGCRYLVTMLWTHDLLIPLLSDISLPKDLSLSVARTAASVDPQLHVRLIRFLVDGMLEGHELEEAEAGRLLEILGVIADANTIQPFLRQMLLHPSPRIRSKITLLVGRGQAAVRALEKLLRDDDSRVRANAVEAFWTRRDPEMLQILQTALRDNNNRVVGNAVLGLYLNGDAQSIVSLMELAVHEDDLFRNTAAWVMGKTQDPRFLPQLGRFLASTKGQFRRTVFNSLNSIKKSMLVRSENPSLNIRVLDVSRSESFRLKLAVTSQNKDLPEIKATEFTVLLRTEPVTAYTCAEQRKDLISVAFILPLRSASKEKFGIALDSAMKSCMASKRASEQCAIVRYREGQATEDGIGPIRLMGQTVSTTVATAGALGNTPGPVYAFTANSATLLTAIEARGTRYDSGMDLIQAIESVLNSPKPSRGARNIIVVIDSDCTITEDSERSLMEGFARHGFALNVISTVPNPEIRRICRETSGTFCKLMCIEDLGAELPIFYAALRCQYLIEFQPPPDFPSLDRIVIQVNTVTSFGETFWQPEDATSAQSTKLVGSIDTSNPNEQTTPA